MRVKPKNMNKYTMAARGGDGGKGLFMIATVLVKRKRLKYIHDMKTVR